MNILKLIKGQFSTTPKNLARKEELVDGVIASIDSARGIARVVHTKAYNIWTKADFKALVDSYQKRLNKTGKPFHLLTEDDQVTLIRTVANDVNRSPLAVHARLYSLGHCRKRGKGANALAGLKKS